MTTQTITFGDLKFSFSKDVSILSGVRGNRPADYTTEVRYNHISPSVNVTKTHEPNGTAFPIKGAMIQGVPVQVVAQSEGATLQAVKKRCDYATSTSVGDAFIAGHEMLMSKIHERDTITLDQAMVNAYLDEMSGHKRERLQALLDSQDFTLPGYTDKVVFAKSEALVKEDGAQPRVVYQGGDMYNLVMGSIVFYLSRRIAEELNERNPLNVGNKVVYCVGMSADEIAEIVHRTPGQAFENDFKNNDGTQPADVRKREAMFYYKLGAPHWFVREFASNTSVRVFTRYGVKGRVSGQRWSGEVTTTTGNGYVNGCTTLAALAMAGITESTSFIYGDDEMTITRQSMSDLCDSYREVAEGSGMKAEPKVVDNRAKVTFLRRRFVPGVKQTLPVPSFGRVLAKLPVRSNNNPAVNDDDYMAGKVLSAAYEHRHIASIRHLLLQTAEQLSDKPHLDMRNQAMAYRYSSTELHELTRDAKVCDPAEFNGFLHTVYGIDEGELINIYAAICDGIIAHSRVNNRRARKRILDVPLTAQPLWDTSFESVILVDAPC